MHLSVEPRDDAGEVSSPADARDSDSSAVDLRQRTQQRVPPHDVGNRAIGPHLFDLCRLEPAQLEQLVGPDVRSAVGAPDAARAVPVCVHGQRDIPPLRPDRRPLRKGPAAPAVDKQHRRKRPRASVGAGVIGKNASRTPTEGLALVVHLPDACDGGTPLRLRHAPERGHVPGPAVSGSTRSAETGARRKEQ